MFSFWSDFKRIILKENLSKKFKDFYKHHNNNWELKFLFKQFLNISWFVNEIYLKYKLKSSGKDIHIYFQNNYKKKVMMACLKTSARSV